ncbi:MAG: polysaccharide pyruvyl transferase family protein [Saprospiraceae bacterium]|nr:polysaccharide pyruvyl transferase family protein [Saprospiraceae bacterium]
MINLYSIRPKGFNVGNDVIYIALKGFVENAFADDEINIISLPATNKYESQKKSGFSKSTIYEINQFGNGVILGGGNLYENGEIDIDPIALNALDKPLMICSVSRGRIYNKQGVLVDRTDVISDSKLKMINDKAAIALSRDDATYQYVKNLGCNNINGACPTLFLKEFFPSINKLSEKYKTDCLISIRTPNLMSVPPVKQYELRDMMLDTIAYLKDNGYENVKILCHDHRDIAFADSFKDVDYLYTDDAYKFINLLRHTRLNLTFRLHSFIPCLSLDIPTIKVSYDERALSLVDTLGMDDWNINYVKDDVMKEVKYRIDNINELETLKAKNNEGHWQDIRQTFEKNFNDFADMAKSTL